MSVGKNAGQRASENLKLAIAHAEAFKLKLQQEGVPESLFKAPNESVDYQIKRALHASNALTLHGPQIDDCIAKAFSEAKLNPENPWHWRVLLAAFAKAYYPPSDSNQYWSGARLTALLAEERRLERVHSNLSKVERNKKLIKWITKQKERIKRSRNADKPKDISVHTLPKLLRMAKDRKANAFLDPIYEEIIRGRTESLSKHFRPDQVAAVSSDPQITQELAEALAIVRLNALRKQIGKTNK